MKPRKLTLISVVLLALLMAGTVVLMSSTGQEPLIAAQTKFTPKHIDLQNTATLTVRIQLLDAENKTVVDQIDPSTVQLEGMIAPIHTEVEYNEAGKPSRFVAVFNGLDVKGVIWHLIGHMGLVRPHSHVPMPIRLTITGQLDDIPPTPWEGSAIALIINWDTGVTPPPP